MAKKKNKIKNGMKISDPVREAKAIANAMRTGFDTSSRVYKSPKDYNRKRAKTINFDC